MEGKRSWVMAVLISVLASTSSELDEDFNIPKGWRMQVVIDMHTVNGTDFGRCPVTEAGRAILYAIQTLLASVLDPNILTIHISNA